MDEGLTEATMMLNFLLFFKDISDLLNVVFTNNAAAVFRLVKVSGQKLILLILSADLIKLLDIDVVIVILETGRVGNGLDTEHEWHADDSADDKDTGDGVLRPEEYRHILLSIAASNLKEVVDHGSNDRRSQIDSGDHVLSTFRLERGWNAFALVGVHGIEPFREDKDIHPAKETEQDDEASNNLKHEAHVVLEENGVSTFGDDTEGHVDYTKDNSQLHLNIVTESELIASVEPGGIKTEGVGAAVELVNRASSVNTTISKLISSSLGLKIVA